MLAAYLKMLPSLSAVRQLSAIEAALVPHLKEDAAKRIFNRHTKALKPPEEPKPVGMRLLDGFRAHGLSVVEQPTTKRPG